MKKKVLFIILIAIVFGSAFGGYSLLKERTYTSEVTFDIPIGYVNINISELEFSQKLVDKYKETIEQEAFICDVYDRVLSDERYVMRCEVEVSTDLISDALRFKQINKTTKFTISVTTTDSMLSYIIAEQVRNALTDSKDEDELDVISHPEQPTVPDSRHTIRNFVFGSIAGLTLSTSTLVIIYLKKRK